MIDFVTQQRATSLPAVRIKCVHQLCTQADASYQSKCFVHLFVPPLQVRSTAFRRRFVHNTHEIQEYELQPEGRTTNLQAFAAMLFLSTSIMSTTLPSSSFSGSISTTSLPFDSFFLTSFRSRSVSSSLISLSVGLLSDFFSINFSNRLTTAFGGLFFLPGSPISFGERNSSANLRVSARSIPFSEKIATRYSFPRITKVAIPARPSFSIVSASRR